MLLGTPVCSPSELKRGERLILMFTLCMHHGPVIRRLHTYTDI